MRSLICFFSCIIIFSCSEPKNIIVSKTNANQIATGSIEEAGLNKDIISSMDSNILNNTYPNIHSVLIAKNNKLVFERYYSGKDQSWGRDLGVVTHHQDSLHDIRSISKGIVSACIGLAIQQGKIKSVDQKIFEFYPEYRHLDTGLKSVLTIKHLLTMTTGQKWNEDVPYSDSNNSEIRMIRNADPVAYALGEPIEKEPGTEWKYNGGSTQLLASIIQKATGKKVDAFADQYLFQPLGINIFEWVRYPGTDLPAAASGLRLTSRDLLKFGLLYINDGKFNDMQILPSEWVKETTSFHIKRPGPPGSNRFGYGYQFWLGTLPPPKDNIEFAAAIGNGNQRIIIDKLNNMVTVVTAGNYNLWNIKNNSDKLVFDFVYAALK